MEKLEIPMKQVSAINLHGSTPREATGIKNEPIPTHKKAPTCQKRVNLFCVAVLCGWLGGDEVHAQKKGANCAAAPVAAIWPGKVHPPATAAHARSTSIPLTFGAQKGVAPSQTQRLASLEDVPEGLLRSDWSAIRAEYEKHRHAAYPVEGQPGVWQARNPGQQWRTRFDGRGFLAQPDGAEWRWGLELQRYGFADQEREKAYSRPAPSSKPLRL